MLFSILYSFIDFVLAFPRPLEPSNKFKEDILCERLHLVATWDRLTNYQTSFHDFAKPTTEIVLLCTLFDMHILNLASYTIG